MLPTKLYRIKQVIFARFPLVEAIYAFNRHTRDRWIAKEAASIPPGARVLDVGAGSCPYRHLFAHCRYIAQDLAALPPEALQGRKGYGKIDIISDINALPLKSESFDIVLCTEVIEHVPDPISAVREISRVLKSRGALYISAPLRSGLHQEPYHFYGGFSPYWYKKFLTEAGFSDISIKAVGGLFKMCGESSLHIIVNLLVLASETQSLAKRLIILLLWLLTWPWCALFFPLLCHVLDSFLPLESGTVGYHVKAIKRSLSC